MSRNLFVTLMVCSVMFALGCGGTAPANSAVNANTNVNAATPVKLDPANMPPGLSGRPITPPANTPGIPANGAVIPKGTTPTPGIPSPAELKKPFRPGTTPTPGIPSPEEIRKALGKPPTNVNTPAPSKENDVPMMKSTKKLGGKPQ